MAELTPFRVLVGRQVRYGGHVCRVVEVLETEQALVLRCEGELRSIQGDQFGKASRRVQPCLTLSLYDPETGELDPVVRDWLQSTP